MERIFAEFFAKDKYYLRMRATLCLLCCSVQGQSCLVCCVGRHLVCDLRQLFRLFMASLSDTFLCAL